MKSRIVMPWKEAGRFARDIMEMNAWKVTPDSYVIEGELVEPGVRLETNISKLYEPIDDKPYGGFTISKWKR